MRNEVAGDALQIPPAPQAILCVDGCPDRLDHLSEALRRAGFTALTAADGGTAVALSAQTRPALAIVNSVIADGIDVVRRLQDGGSMPVIFVVSGPDCTCINEAADAGAMSVLVRPVELPHLLPAVRTALLRHLELQQLRHRLQRLELMNHRRHQTGMVVGLLMERLQITPQEAFTRLRRYAREHNRRIGDVAAEILRDSENLLRVTRQIANAGGAIAAKSA